eukprot:1681567-Prymnesium_polylepis.1
MHALGTLPERANLRVAGVPGLTVLRESTVVLTVLRETTVVLTVLRETDSAVLLESEGQVGRAGSEDMERGRAVHVQGCATTGAEPRRHASLGSMTECQKKRVRGVAP